MNIQQLIQEIHHLPPDQIEMLLTEIDRLCTKHGAGDAHKDKDFQHFMSVVERYQTRYPGEFRFDREEANER